MNSETGMKYEVLKKYFGYSSFRTGQEELVDSILNGEDTLGIMPTGAGKSLCFQIPAMCMDGITLVVSPLISLMKDQVTTLVQNGIRGAYLNSSLTYQQYLKALSNAENNVYKIIYVAPERLDTPGFLSFAMNADISMVTVDEAHCVSQWGHDFRPSYLKIADFIEKLPKRPVVSAFTATATRRVREDIIRILKLQKPHTVITGFNRENLYFEVRQPSSRKAELMNIISEHNDETGIVYCATRKNVEEICEELCKRGINATRYHAGLDDDERRENQEDFLFDRASVMVATNAFGMGIDKSDVRYVVHYNMPKNMESYYQEAGRAGRDGSSARCILLYSAQDIILNKFLIEKSENSELDPQTAAEVKRRDLERLNKMAEYCTTTMCLRKYMLEYFGERLEQDCQSCSNCNKEYESIDVTEYARRIVQCAAELDGRFGVKVICDVLRGKESERTQRWGLEEAASFGALSDVSEKHIRQIISSLQNMGCLKTVGTDYPKIETAEGSAELLSSENRIFIKETEAESVKRKREERKRDKRQNRSIDAEEDNELFDKLRERRMRLAKRQNVPAYVIFNDSTLHEMARVKPKTRDDMMSVSGVGYVKFQKYGEAFLEVIKEY